MDIYSKLELKPSTLRYYSIKTGFHIDVLVVSSYQAWLEDTSDTIKIDFYDINIFLNVRLRAQYAGPGQSQELTELESESALLLTGLH